MRPRAIAVGASWSVSNARPRSTRGKASEITLRTRAGRNATKKPYTTHFTWRRSKGAARR
jgi:hypothetical protein